MKDASKVKKERRSKKEKKSLEIKSNKNGHKKRRRRKTVDTASVALVGYIRIQRVCVCLGALQHQSSKRVGCLFFHFVDDGTTRARAYRGASTSSFTSKSQSRERLTFRRWATRSLTRVVAAVADAAAAAAVWLFSCFYRCCCCNSSHHHCLLFCY